MHILIPRDWDDALATMARGGGVLPVGNGTDLMVQVNRGELAGRTGLALSGLPAFADWSAGDGRLRLGTGVTYTDLLRRIPVVPGALRAAAATVGSSQIRNRGTVGGALGTASPSGDVLPALLACHGLIELVSADGVRHVPARTFCTGPGTTVRRADELIAAVILPAATGPQGFTKVARRRALASALSSFAVALWPEHGVVSTGVGAVADKPFAAVSAERFISAQLAANGRWESGAPIPEPELRRFGELVAERVPRTADAYPRHLVEVLARRGLGRAWDDYRKEVV